MPASPLLLLVPYRYKAAVLYSQIPISASASGDFVVSRAGNTASRILGNGNIETGVLANIARINYPRTGVASGCAGLLVEPAATNFVLNSQNTATDWTIGANTASGYVDVIGVSGNTVTASASGGIGGSVFVRRSLNTALASGSTYTVSFLMRQTGAHTIGGYWIGIAGVGDIGGGFDVSGSFSSGAIYSAAGATNRIRRVERWGTDVYRCSETFTLTASGTVDRILMGPLGAVNNPAITSSGNTMAFAAPQIELGAVPTTFIPTTTASVTRNADVVTLSGAVSGCIGQTEGTLYAEIVAQPYNNASFPAILQVDDGADSQRFAIFIGPSGGIRVRFNASGVNSIFDSTNPATLVVGQTYKIAAAFGFNGSQAFYINGVLQVSGSVTAGPFTAALNRVMLGHRAGIVSPFLIRSAALYTTRLTNTELAALTTL